MVVISAKTALQRQMSFEQKKTTLFAIQKTGQLLILVHLVPINLETGSLIGGPSFLPILLVYGSPDSVGYERY
jgi:thiosulfate reductase cytochrome b subunit